MANGTSYSTAFWVMGRNGNRAYNNNNGYTGDYVLMAQTGGTGSVRGTSPNNGLWANPDGTRLAPARPVHLVTLMCASSLPAVSSATLKLWGSLPGATFTVIGTSVASRDVGEHHAVPDGRASRCSWPRRP